MSNNRKRIPRSTLIPALLVIYLAVMARIGWPEYAAGRTSALYYFGIIAATLAVIVLLHFNLKKRDKLRAEREADIRHAQATREADRSDRSDKSDTTKQP